MVSFDSEPELVKKMCLNRSGMTEEILVASSVVGTVVVPYDREVGRVDIEGTDFVSRPGKFEGKTGSELAEAYDGTFHGLV